MKDSILKNTQLNIENFEDYIAVGTKPQQILTVFRKTGKEMDEWCKEAYGIASFHTIYEMVRQAIYKEFLETVKELGCRGNPSALNIINQAISDHENDNVVKIVFENGLKEENEEDKKD